jgi:hypothetical protein
LDKIEIFHAAYSGTFLVWELGATALGANKARVMKGSEFKQCNILVSNAVGC